MSQDLPIDQHLEAICTALRKERRIVVTAPPGAGKTTRVPLAVSAALGPGQTVLLEPRRVAARNAAKMMAQGRVGEHVGYVMRDERRVSEKTRIVVMTEGVLTRRLLDDALLDGVTTVILDEFHERSVHADFALCLCKELLSVRDDFHVVVMSATLDAGAVAAYLDDAPVVEVTVPPFPLTVEYKRPRADERMANSASSAVLSLLGDKRTEGGDVLCFLPGRGEIERTAERLNDIAPSLDVRPLYGALPDAEQRAVFSTDPEAPRRCILATNIAESSVTVPRVRAVVDTGFERRTFFNEKTQSERLVLRRISGQSATQRAGRAARLGPGVCLRLWGEKENAQRRGQLDPEVGRTDPLALVVNALHYAAVDPMSLDWLTLPGRTRVNTALATLRRLGVLPAEGFVLTPLGEKLRRWPLSTRAGVFLHHAEALGLHDAAVYAVLLDEPDTWGRIDARRCDLEARHELLTQRGGGNAKRLFSRAARLRVRATKQAPQALSRALLLAFADRVGEQRVGDEERALLSNGTGVRLRRGPPRAEESYFVASRLHEAERGGVVAEWVTFVSRDLVSEVLEAQIRDTPVLTLDGPKGHLVSQRQHRLGAITLSARDAPLSGPEREDAFFALACERREAWFKLDDEAASLWARMRFAAQASGLDRDMVLDDDVLLQWGRPQIVRQKNLGALGRVGWKRILSEQMPYNLREVLRTRFPSAVEVPSGRSVALDYTDSEHGAPILAVKIQEMFGSAQTPSIDDGRIALRLHLLAPNKRPAQVTSDIAGFWARTYVEVKKELKQRYPKHPWPDDPLNAIPTRHTKKAFAARQGASKGRTSS